jgi:hypothetical protein
MTCPFCQSKLDDVATVCGACGAYIERESLALRMFLLFLSPLISSMFAAMGAGVIWMIAFYFQGGGPQRVSKVLFFAIAVPVEIWIVEHCCKGDHAHWERRL